MTWRIVIVEDDPELRELFRELAQGVELEVVAVAENGFLGLKKIRDLKPDLVVTDLNMPIENGIYIVSNVTDIPICLASVGIKESAKRRIENAYPHVRAVKKDFLSVKEALLEMIAELDQKSQ